MQAPQYALVLSDLHFGDTRCSLHSMRTAHALVQKLQDYKPLHEIFLLGDILDLQLATWAQAIEGRILGHASKRAVGFRYFLNFLIEQTGASVITYVPGNHDYKIFDYHSIDRHLILPLRKGKKLSGKVSFFRNFTPSFLQGLLHSPDVQFRVVYPHHTLKLGRERILLAHGHYFDPAQSFYQDIAKAFPQPITKGQIPALRKTFFRRASTYQNVVSGLSIQPGLRALFNSIYQPVNVLKQSLRHRSRKTFLTRAMRRNIECYVSYCCRGKIDGVIFGHTHRPGKAVIHDGAIRHVWNCGTFLRESPESPLGSFLTIRLNGQSSLEDAVRIHLL